MFAQRLELSETAEANKKGGNLFNADAATWISDGQTFYVTNNLTNWSRLTLALYSARSSILLQLLLLVFACCWLMVF